ncbi:MAG: glycosyltransferase family 1 protein, partial [Gammaproteobacteria bacterium]|nr:glycosyltransferase family 1 protein [Gemmatimonadota bacterium]NIU72450.1 glycosyltransferase family 1 protein [Gammaproteobacteria bacterium]
PGDVSALAEGIRALRQEPDLAATLRRRGRERVRSFDTERWLDGVEALLDAARRLVAPDT